MLVADNLTLAHETSDFEDPQTKPLFQGKVDPYLFPPSASFSLPPNRPNPRPRTRATPPGYILGLRSVQVAMSRANNGRGFFFTPRENLRIRIRFRITPRESIRTDDGPHPPRALRRRPHRDRPPGLPGGRPPLREVRSSGRPRAGPGPSSLSPPE